MVLHVFKRHSLRTLQSLVNQNVGLIKVNWFSYCRAFAMHCESSKSEIVVCNFSFFLFIAFSSISSFFSFCGTLNIFLSSMSWSIIWEMLKMKKKSSPLFWIYRKLLTFFHWKVLVGRFIKLLKGNTWSSVFWHVIIKK